MKVGSPHDLTAPQRALCAGLHDWRALVVAAAPTHTHCPVSSGMLRTLVQPSHFSDVHEVYNQQQAPRSSGEFLHNARLWLLCLPSLLLLLDFGGGVMLGAAALGLMITYIFDALDQPEACFVSFWVTVGAQVVGHAVGSFLVLGASVRGLGLTVVSAAFTLLLGVWGSLQLGWLPAQEPGLARLGERLLFALLPVPCAALVRVRVRVRSLTQP